MLENVVNDPLKVLEKCLNLTLCVLWGLSDLWPCKINSKQTPVPRLKKCPPIPSERFAFARLGPLTFYFIPPETNKSNKRLTKCCFIHKVNCWTQDASDFISSLLSVDQLQNCDVSDHARRPILAKTFPFWNSKKTRSWPEGGLWDLQENPSNLKRTDPSKSEINLCCRLIKTSALWKTHFTYF